MRTNDIDNCFSLVTESESSSVSKITLLFEFYNLIITETKTSNNCFTDCFLQN